MYLYKIPISQTGARKTHRLSASLTRDGRDAYPFAADKVHIQNIFDDGSHRVNKP